MHGPHSILSLGHDATVLTHRHAFLTRAGYAVTSAAQPTKAIRLLENCNFDIVLAGLSTHSERVSIEKAQRLKNVPVIFLCCDRFDPASGTCKCEKALLSSEELLRRIAGAITAAHKARQKNERREESPPSAAHEVQAN